MTLVIGLDLDNTLVDYDRAFHEAARAAGLIPDDCLATKTAVRDRLRAEGREDDWTRLQGTVYGEGMGAAEPFPGALDAIRDAVAAGHTVYVISHRTRTPYLGPPADLHAAARAWLDAAGVTALIGADAIHLEAERAGKLARIAAVAPDAFVDDLPEFLADPAFPSGVRRLLFDPADAHAEDPAFERCRSWAEVGARLMVAAC